MPQVRGPARGSAIVPRYAVYGITLETEFDFSWPVLPGTAAPDLRFTCVDAPPTTVDWDAHPPVHGVAVPGDTDPPAISYHRLPDLDPDLDVVRIRRVADHYVWPDRIVCHLHDPALAYLAEIQLLGLVLALWLERRGVPSLHASGVVVDGSAVAFLGVKGGGKTTAAAGLVAEGHRLLADDLLALEIADDEVLARPGYPMLRLWPDQAEHFLGGHEPFPLVHPAFTKRRIPVGSGFGDFHDRSAPLRCIYLPTRDPRAGLVEVTPLRARAALLAMVGESFLRDAVHGLGLAATRLSKLAGVVDRVEVRTLRYPAGFEHLPELARAVAADVAGLASARHG